MKTTTNITTKLFQLLVIGLTLTSITSCGSYQYTSRDDDSIYADARPKERIVYVDRPVKNKTNYFLEQAKEFEDLNDDDVLVDIDSLNSDKKDPSGNYNNGQPWENTSGTTVNIYNMSPYYNRYSNGFDGYYNAYPYYRYPNNPYYYYGYNGYYDYYNPYYSDYYYYPSAYIGFGFPFYNGYFYYNNYRGYYPYYNNYYSARSYANYQKRTAYNTHLRKRMGYTGRYNRNFKNNINKYSSRSNYSKSAYKNSKTKKYKRNNSNTYKRNNSGYKSNSNNSNSSYRRSNYSRSSGSSGSSRSSSSGNRTYHRNNGSRPQSYNINKPRLEKSNLNSGYKRNRNYVAASIKSRPDYRKGVRYTTPYRRSYSNTISAKNKAYSPNKRNAAYNRSGNRNKSYSVKRQNTTRKNYTSKKNYVSHRSYKPSKRAVSYSKPRTSSKSKTYKRNH